MAQVVIVGAGPTGVCLALMLAERGIEVVLVEAARSFRRQFRGQALMPSGLEALAQMNLSALLETVPHELLDAWEFWIEGKRLFRAAEPIETGGSPCTLVSQPEFLAAVVARAIAYPGFEFIPGATVQGLHHQGQRISGVQLSTGRSLFAELVVAADGRNSSLRDMAGLMLTQQPKSIDVLWFSLPSASPVCSENTFYAVVKNGNSFGFFRNAQGQAQLGWGLPNAASIDWKAVDWHQQILAHSPSWLAAHLKDQAAAFAQPRLFSVTVGLAPQWSKPGLLLLGDAAHPMSPIRAQGINMALRDAVVATNHLVPLWRRSGERAAGDPTNNVNTTQMDEALQTIQAEREPEIRRAQVLQSQELAQGELLRQFPLLRWGASQFAPLVGLGVKRSWLRRQRQLRLGVVPVQLKV